MNQNPQERKASYEHLHVLYPHTCALPPSKEKKMEQPLQQQFWTKDTNLKNCENVDPPETNHLLHIVSSSYHWQKDLKGKGKQRAFRAHFYGVHAPVRLENRQQVTLPDAGGLWVFYTATISVLMEDTSTAGLSRK